MTDTTKKLSDAARKLSPNDRLELVELLLDSLDAPDSENDKLWAVEAADRLAAYRKGEMKALPFADVLAKYTA